MKSPLTDDILRRELAERERERAPNEKLNYELVKRHREEDEIEKRRLGLVKMNQDKREKEAAEKAEAEREFAAMLERERCRVRKT